MRLDEKYRPYRLSDLIGQEKAVKKVQTITARGWGGRAWYITGKSGQGKTSLARIIAGMGADPENTTEIVARQITPSFLAEMQHRWMYVPMGQKPGYALIVNEAHGLTKPIIEIFLDLLENLRGNVVVVFTTTRDGNDLFEEQLDAGPFASRCTDLQLTPRGLAERFARRIKEIAEMEGLDGKPEKAYIDLVRSKGNNFRAALQAVESGQMLA